MFNSFFSRFILKYKERNIYICLFKVLCHPAGFRPLYNSA